MKLINRYQWYFISIFMLVIYLAFFYSLNAADAHQVKFVGAGFATVWLACCFVFQSCFRNRFEFGIHTLLTLDFVLEALVTQHSGYGFYYCAACFWSVFWVYHHLPQSQEAGTTTGARVAGNEGIGETVQYDGV